LKGEWVKKNIAVFKWEVAAALHSRLRKKKKGLISQLIIHDLHVGGTHKHVPS